ncbi:MAG TPA: deoxyribose-phosphate aldolase [Clostridiales bacterium]|nr:deoxyribose-phosphate aldolase [Clostridiales bacterium]
MDNLARMIDHTALKPDTSPEAIRKLCAEALQYGFASVCVNPCYVQLCHSMLQGSPVKVCTVVGFPLGATTTETKAFETRNAVDNGAQEIDMVINISSARENDADSLKKDIAAVVQAAGGVLVKVILETCLLTDSQKVLACQAAKDAGADFVKTSTGFSISGATAEDVALMCKTVGDMMGVKAAGGIRDYATALKMIEAGASRIGASASVKIIGEAQGLP